MTEKNWEKFYKTLVSLLLGSLIVSAIIWKACGRGFNYCLDRAINLDFFTTFCGTLGISGLGVAIWQIAELKTRQEEIATETAKELSKMKNIEDVSRISKFKETISDIKTLFIEKKYADADPKMAELKDELHKCKRICPDYEPKISSILQQLNPIQSGINNVRLIAENTVDTELILNTLDEIKELFGLIIEVCKSK